MREEPTDRQNEEAAPSTDEETPAPPIRVGDCPFCTVHDPKYRGGTCDCAGWEMEEAYA